MIRLLAILALLSLATIGLAWVWDQPGDITIVFRAQRYEFAPIVALCGLIAVIAALLFVAWLLRLVFGAPARIARARRAAQKEKSLNALSKGMIAAGAGDLRAAQRASAIADKGLGDTPLALLLRAQTAQLAGDRETTRKTFEKLAEHPDARPLGLRGLHVEARRTGDTEAARLYAEEAHKIAPAAWAGAALLEHHSAGGDWPNALASVEANAAQRLIDRPTADRQRAVLKTAIALDMGDAHQGEALKLAREAADLAPDLTPAAALAGRLMARGGDLRRASKLLEAAWKACPHPDIARVYIDLRPGDSAADRLARAKTLARLVQDDPESDLCVAGAAIDAREFDMARQSIAPLIDATAISRPTRRVCLTMADIEEAEHGQTGLAREWLARAARAPRDKAWVADGVISDTWGPVSPVTGKLDAFRWTIPAEKLAAMAPWSPPSPEDFIETPMIEASPVEAPVSPPPAPADDAATKLAEIRAAARAAPRAANDPAPIAPDDPGPKPRDAA